MFRCNIYRIDFTCNFLKLYAVINIRPRTFVGVNIKFNNVQVVRNYEFLRAAEITSAREVKL